MKLCVITLVFLCITTLASGAKKVVSPRTSASNEQVDILATLYMTPDEVKAKLGEDPGLGVAVLEVRVIPKSDDAVRVSPDDFILLAHDDGERSRPFEPSQIAGEGAMVLTNKPEKKGKSSVAFEGAGGLIGGGTGSSPGNSAAPNIKTKMNDRSEGNKNLLKALEQHQLATKESKEPVEGLLYFPLDGKHKLKNMAVLYRGPAGYLNLEFEH